MDYKCDLNCPAFVSEMRCCAYCSESHENHKSKANKKYWTKSKGFWKPGGCSLPRDMMPDDCREVDCRNRVWVVIRKWSAGAWRDLAMHEIQPGYEAVGIQSRMVEDGKGLADREWDIKNNKWKDTK